MKPPTEEHFTYGYRGHGAIPYGTADTYPSYVPTVNAPLVKEGVRETVLSRDE